MRFEAEGAVLDGKKVGTMQAMENICQATKPGQVAQKANACFANSSMYQLHADTYEQATPSASTHNDKNQSLHAVQWSDLTDPRQFIDHVNTNHTVSC
jgi:hypothetical protein